MLDVHDIRCARLRAGLSAQATMRHSKLFRATNETRACDYQRHSATGAVMIGSRDALTIYVYVYTYVYVRVYVRLHLKNQD